MEQVEIAATSAASLEVKANEAPNYEDTFPALPSSGAPAAGATSSKPVWGGIKPKMQLKSSNVTQVFLVPMEERRFKGKGGAELSFGQDEQAKICRDIMTATGVHIELSLQKDKGLTVVVTGKPNMVLEARRQVFNKLQTQAFIELTIPRQYHRFLLGKGGKILQRIELETATKIKLPPPGEESDIIKITGIKEGIEKAKHEVMVIYEEQSKRAFERLNIPHVYHPFICGPDNANIKALMERTGVRINVPPPRNAQVTQKDEVVVSGEKDGVAVAIAELKAIYEEKHRRCQTVSVEVKKAQHRFILGPRATNLNEILGQTGVSVEIPPSDHPSETITLRGEQDKLGPALTMVYAKANSIIPANVPCPIWLHRYIIGKKGAKIQDLTREFPKVHIEFSDAQPLIQLEGPPEECEPCRQKIDLVVKDLVRTMDFAEVSIAKKFHRHIIGKAGANISKIKDDTGCQITIPGDEDDSIVIRVEGEKAGVIEAAKRLKEMGDKMENERSKDVIIEQRFHRLMIGTGGAGIKEIRDKHNQVQINFPDAGKKSDIVTLRGPKADVDKCAQTLTKLHKDLIAQHYQEKVRIFKQYHKNVIGKGGANIRKIRDETDTRIDLPAENSDSDLIVITGLKENVQKAVKMVEAIQKDLVNIKEESIQIPHKLHNTLIGAKGRLIQSISDECGGVVIRFPPEGAKSDKVTVRGPVDDVDAAVLQLQELATKQKEASYTEEVRAKPEYHRFLIGRNGSNTRKIRDETGARVIFPNSRDSDQEVIVLLGKEEDVKKARPMLEQLIKDMENIGEDTVEIDPKHHRHFVARRGEILNQISSENGGVSISFPRQGSDSSTVTIKGAKECVSGAKARLLEEVDEVESRVTMDVVIPQQHHRTIMGARGAHIQQITTNFNVNIKFPERPPQRQTSSGSAGEPEANGSPAPEELVNGNAEPSSPSAPSKYDVIVISGKQENCEQARDAMMARVPISEEKSVPFEFHRFIIGQKGAGVRKLMMDNDVNISIPSPDLKSDIITITGPRDNVNRAKDALMERVEELEKEQEDRELRSFTTALDVNPDYHSKIIGVRGVSVRKLQEEFGGVQIRFPRRSDENQAEIVIQGYEKQAMACKERILSMVAEMDKMIVEEVPLDARIHPRLIGARGKQIRRIMDDYMVDIKFPTKADPDPNMVRVMGEEDNVLDCLDYLRNLEEEYMQDVTERAVLDSYVKPSRDQAPKQQQDGFMVSGAPWSQQTPDMHSSEDFPSMAAAGGRAPTNQAWGPSVKKF